MLKNVTDTVFYVGVDDKDIDLFENQYIVPNGIAYNSYVIMDEKIAIMDMVDAKCLRHIIVMCWQKKNCKFYMQIPPSRF